ncbi:MAG: pyruvate, phosphate dikinase, partial [Deltaproteobacteria bacterium]|nr:pyruvate, phosphate dikinase [Deltaproteobacteria bacterium]
MGDLVRAYSLYGRMTRYPALVDAMRELFRAALAERGVVEEAALADEARREAARDGAPDDEERVRTFLDALTDLHFARSFSDAEIEDHINFARKKDVFRKLSRIVNTEGVTSARIKKALAEFCSIPQGDMILSPNEVMGARVALISHFISSQLPFVGIAKEHVTIRDVDELLESSYWDRRRPGKIGGKAAGMFLASKIVLPRFGDRDPELEQVVRVPESYYFNSGIFSDFVDHNGLDRLYSHKYKTRDEIEEDYRHIARVFQESTFPPDVVEDFRQFLARVGDDPLILRSSTLLEDNFGFAFSGKYDSVFLANQGSAEDRLREFMWGLNRVHMSTYAPAPILYRRDHKLLDFDERMAVLVQKVVGRRYGDYFFPFASGVGYSHNAHRWTPRISREEGLVRLVCGLGTRAVDRVAADYPRMVPLGHPLLRPEVDAAQIAKYSQRFADVLNLRSGQLETHPCVPLLAETDHPELLDALSLAEDGHLTAPLFRGQRLDFGRACVTFENLLKKTPFVRVTRKVLQALHEAYRGPVDVEFAWDDGKFYLLQCRPFGIKEHRGKVTLPAGLEEESIVFSAVNVGSNRIVRDLEYCVYVDPKAYGRLATREEKLAVGRAVSHVNRFLEGKRYALFGPGRWGSNDINLGVRVGYEDINNTLILAEVAFREGGSTPEVSYGTHFFNDLVEAEIVPVAIHPDRPDALFQERFFLDSPNLLAAKLPE